MRLDESTLDKIAEIICESPVYRSGREMTNFFARAGLSRFSHDGSTRRTWCLECLHACAPSELESVIKRLASPYEYQGDKDTCTKAVDAINRALYIEGIQVYISKVKPMIKTINPDYSNDGKQKSEIDFPSAPEFFSRVIGESAGSILRSCWDEIGRCLHAEAYLAATVMAGSLLEGVLFFLLQKNRKVAYQCSCAPTNKDGKVKNLDLWKLGEMIGVAHELGWIGHEVKKLSEPVRDFRNSIHLAKQLENGEGSGHEIADIAWRIVQKAIREIEKFHAMPDENDDVPF